MSISASASRLTSRANSKSTSARWAGSSRPNLLCHARAATAASQVGGGPHRDLRDLLPLNA